MSRFDLRFEERCETGMIRDEKLLPLKAGSADGHLHFMKWPLASWHRTTFFTTLVHLINLP